MTSQNSYSNEELSKEIRAVQRALADIKRMLSGYIKDTKKPKPEVGYS